MSDKSKDIFGIKVYGEALKIVVKKAAGKTTEFLSKICMPAAGEFGLMMKDGIRYWRLNNINIMVEKAQGKFKWDSENQELILNPRIGLEIIENSSWQDDESILEMWAGLLASSLDENPDDANLMFIRILNNLSSVQCKLLNYLCSKCEVKIDKNNLIYTDKYVELEIQTLYRITGIIDISRLDRELDYLRSLELLPGGGLSGGGGFQLNQEDFSLIKLIPTSLALHLYARAQGIKDVLKYYHQRK